MDADLRARDRAARADDSPEASAADLVARMRVDTACDECHSCGFKSAGRIGRMPLVCMACGGTGYKTRAMIKLAAYVGDIGAAIAISSGDDRAVWSTWGRGCACTTNGIDGRMSHGFDCGGRPSKHEVPVPTAHFDLCAWVRGLRCWGSEVEMRAVIAAAYKVVMSSEAYPQTWQFKVGMLHAALDSMDHKTEDAVNAWIEAGRLLDEAWRSALDRDGRCEADLVYMPWHPGVDGSDGSLDAVMRIESAQERVSDHEIRAAIMKDVGAWALKRARS